MRHRRRRERARQHQPFERDVDDACALRVQPAERGEQQRRRRPDRREDERDGENFTHKKLLAISY
jgi:hypothetical protein